MGLFDRIDDRYKLAKFNAAEGVRDFPLGSAVVDPYWSLGDGKSKDTFSPAKYGDYIATSNPVYAVITLRADLLSSLPLKVYSLKGGDKVESTGGAFFDLLKHVNPFWTYNRLIKMTEQSLGLWGEAYWFLERGKNGLGAPKEIWWARPDRVKVVPHPKKYIDKFLYEPSNGSTPLEFAPAEVVWFRYPNVLDEFGGLSPLAAARLSADVNNAAMQANYNLYKQGMLAGGFILPPKENTYSPKQARKIEASIFRRHTGADKAHRWGVMLEDAQIKEMGMTNKEAQYLDGLNFTIDDISRAYKVPVDLIGGQRTYQNLAEAERAVWTRAIRPEHVFLSEEINEQLAPMFGEEFVEFDDSEIDALHEAATDKWKRDEGQIKVGAVTINEWRDKLGLEPVPWGDDPPKLGVAAPAAPLPGEDKKKKSDDVEDEDEDEDDRTARDLTREIIYKSPEHLLQWRKHERKGLQYERRLGKVVADLMRRQRDSVMDRLKADAPRGRSPADSMGAPFDLDEWVKKFREAIRPVLDFIVADAGADALDEIALVIDFDLTDSNFNKFIEARAQRFATEINATTYKKLQATLSQGIAKGEDIPTLAARVDATMGDRIKSSATTIARTEVNGAVNGGRLISWAQSGVVTGKAWIAALDTRTRETHISAHTRYQSEPILLTENFRVGEGSGPSPGQIGIAGEDINCRCSMIPIVDERAYRILSGATPIASHNYFIQITDEARMLDGLSELAELLEAKT